MEQFDILNKNSEKTGLIADKNTPLKDGQYYLGVHAYVYNAESQFLLQQRALHKALLPGAWDIHMGHVMAGETSKEGIIREIHEEIGLTFPENNIDYIGQVIWEKYHLLIDVYFLQIDFDINRLSLQEEEVIGVKSVSAVDALALISNMDYRPIEYREMVTAEVKRRIMGS